ncbi:MAG: hypothetical protein JOZ94_24635 [Xanthobacteraceae bacterium]|nr:hypothetical protein [Xanthobacteraceae bacterium]
MPLEPASLFVFSPPPNQSRPARNGWRKAANGVVVIDMRKLGGGSGALAIDRAEFGDCEHHSPPAAWRRSVSEQG